MSFSDNVGAGFVAVATAVKSKINNSEKGVANGVATLDGSGKVPQAQLPGYLDDVVEYANYAAFPGTGTAGIIYIDISNGKQYRWSGSAYASTGGGGTQNVFIQETEPAVVVDSLWIQRLPNGNFTMWVKGA